MSLNNILKTRNKKTEEINFNGIKSINDSEITFKNNLFTFNSGIYTLPLMTHILNKNKFENNIKQFLIFIRIFPNSNKTELIFIFNIFY